MRCYRGDGDYLFRRCYVYPVNEDDGRVFLLTEDEGILLAEDGMLLLVSY
jgi:hypothetical protein